MTDYRANAEHHLTQAAEHAPGTAEERYHSYAAGTWASLNAAEAQREQTAANQRIAELQMRLLAVAEPMLQAPTQPTEVTE